MQISISSPHLEGPWRPGHPHALYTCSILCLRQYVHFVLGVTDRSLCVKRKLVGVQIWCEEGTRLPAFYRTGSQAHGHVEFPSTLVLNSTTDSRRWVTGHPSASSVPPLSCPSPHPTLSLPPSLIPSTYYLSSPSINSTFLVLPQILQRGYHELGLHLCYQSQKSTTIIPESSLTLLLG